MKAEGIREPGRLQELYRMGYRGECDGHDRAWHSSVAKDRRELDALTRGAEEAKRNLDKEAAEFIPTP